MNKNHLLIFVFLAILFQTSCTERGQSQNATQKAVPTVAPTTIEVFTPDDDMMLFQDIAQGDSLTARITTPTIVISQNTDSLLPIRAWFEPSVFEKIVDVGFEHNWIAIVFSGKKGSSGYRIMVTNIYQEKDEIYLVVNLEEPAEEQAVSDVISFPFHIISVSSKDIALPNDVLVKMVDDKGNTLAETVIQ